MAFALLAVDENVASRRRGFSHRTSRSAADDHLRRAAGQGYVRCGLVGAPHLHQAVRTTTLWATERR